MEEKGKIEAHLDFVDENKLMEKQKEVDRFNQSIEGITNPITRARLKRQIESGLRSEALHTIANLLRQERIGQEQAKEIENEILR